MNNINSSVLFHRPEKLGDRYRDALHLDHNVALGHRAVVGEHHHRVILPGIQLNYRAAAHAEELVHRDHGLAKHHGDLDLDAFDVGGHEATWKIRCDAGANMLSAELTRAATGGPEWVVRPGLLPYPEAVAFMEARVAKIAAGGAPEMVWLVEHPPIYTAGTSANDSDLLDARFPVFKTGRGGQFTYHGPGQRVVYPMLDLKRRKPDVRGYVRDLEEWLIRALAQFGVKGERRTDRVGIWVDRGGGREDKIAA